MIDKVDVSRQAKKTSLYLQKFDCPMNSDLIVTFSADIQKQFTALWFWMTNADNVDERFDGVKNDNGTWTVKVPASHFEHYGFVKQSVRVWVTIDGSDYCVAFADADILPDNPCAIIGQGTWRELKLKVDELEADIKAKASAPKVLSDWLYQLDFDDIYEAFGSEWRREHFVDAGACTSIFNTKIFGRNYDWKYSDEAVFVVRTPRRGDKYASVGVASLGSYLTRTMVDGGEYTNIYKALPTMLQDGVNEKGLCASIHVVKSNPDKDDGWTGTTLDAFGAVRYVLDHFDNAEDAADWIAENVYIPTKFKEATGYSVQFLLANNQSMGYVVQDGTIRQHPYMVVPLTNFRLFDVDGQLHTSRSEVAVYDPYGQGIERMRIILSSNEDTSTVQGMRNVLNAVNFTKAYNTEATTPWISEFVDEELGLSLSSPDEDFEDVRNIAKFAFDGRDRFHPTHVEYKGEEYDVETWQTVHSSIYDLVAKTLRIIVQEGTEEYVFKCEVAQDVPTKTSDLINDSGFLTSVSWKDVTGKPTIPTKTSDLTNDSGFLTSHQSLNKYYTKSQTYSQYQVDTKLASKANTSDIPTKTSQLMDGEWITLSGTYDDDTTFSFKVWKQKSMPKVTNNSGGNIYCRINGQPTDILLENSQSVENVTSLAGGGDGERGWNLGDSNQNWYYYNQFQNITSDISITNYDREPI